MSTHVTSHPGQAADQRRNPRCFPSVVEMQAAYRTRTSARALAETTMPIGPDVLVFISATKALLQSLSDHPLNEEERTELECCLRELTALLSDERDAA